MSQKQILSPEALKVFESVPDLYLVLSPDLHILTASDTYLEATLAERHEIVGKNVFEAFPDNPETPHVKSVKNLHASLQEVLRSKKPHQMALQRYDVPRPQQMGGGFEEKYWNPVNLPVLDRDGEVLYIIHKVSNITEQIKYQHQVRELIEWKEEALLQAAWEQKKLQALFMQAPVAIAIYGGQDHMIELVNPQMCAVLGRKSEELLGKPLFDALPELKQQGYEGIFQEVYATGVLFKHAEIPATLWRNGALQQRYFNMVYQPLFNAQMQITGIIQIGYEVTDQIEDRRQMQESTEKYSSLFKTMKQGFCILEMIFDEKNNPLDYRFLEVNPVFEKQTGLKNAAGRTARELVPTLEEHWFRRYGRVALTGEAVRFTEGSEAMGRWFDVHAYRLGGNNSRRVALLFTDITESKQVEENLRQTNSWFRLVNKATQDAIWDWDLQTHQTRWNEGVQTMFNYGPEAVGNASSWWKEHVHPDDRERVVKSIHAVIDSGQHHWSAEYRFLTGDGAYKIVYDRGFVLHDEAGRPTRMLGSMQDITERKWAEEALKESEQHFRTFANNIQNLAWMAAPDGWIYWYNQRWYDYTGTNLEEMQGWGWEKVHHPDHIDRIKSFVQEAWGKGETWELTFPLRGADGHYRWFLTSAFAVKDGNGEVLRWIGTNTNIDEQVQAETLLAEKNKELIRINNDLDSFIYTASHDLRAPILNIEGLMSILSTALPAQAKEEEKIQFLMGMIHTSIDKFKTTIKDLTEVAKAQNDGEEALKKVSFAEILEEVTMNIQGDIDGYKATIQDDFSGAPEIYFSRKNLRSILYNLLSNAIKYSSPVRRPSIKISSSRPDAAHVLLCVEDNGLGIKEQDKAKVFKMFTRLHQHVEGTGVGMTIVKKIVDNNGGRIEIDSKEGEGSIFRIYLKV